MKKIFTLLLVVAGISTVSLTAKGSTDSNLLQSEYNYRGNKGNISADNLPEAVKEYLTRNYPSYTVMVAKKKNNGKYYVKIRYNENQGRPYYRSLVFDYNGDLIKG